MSLLPTLKLPSIGSLCERVRDHFVAPNKKIKGARRPRRLMIDSLEERRLLSITADGTTLTIDTGSVTTVSAQSIASDDAGDTVITWTSQDVVWDSDRGTYVNDANVYAEYLCQNTQEIILAQGTSSFALIYGGNTITQTLTFSSTDAAGYSSDANISGSVTLKFGSQSVSVSYWEYDYQTFATDLQSALQALGGQLAGAEVTATGSRTFEITFNAALDATTGTVATTANKLATQTYLSINYDQTTFTTGFLSAAQISTTSVPVVIGTIKVSSSSPEKTASAIQTYMEGKTTDTEQTAPTFEQPSSSTVTTSTGLDVTVTSIATADDPNGLYHFQVVFNGNAGMKILDQLVVVNAKNSSGTAVSCSTKILKQSSEVFRVNNEEVDDEFTFGLDVTNQFGSAVAMDGDGDFVITWTSQNADGTTDVYARRFETQAYVKQESITTYCWSYTAYNEDATTSTHYIQSIRPVDAPDQTNLTVLDDGSTFRVNTITSNSQGMIDLTSWDGSLSIAMNKSGQYVIAWSALAQNSSYFNNVYMRCFEANGESVDIEVLASERADGRIDANRQDGVTLALSDSGLICIAYQALSASQGADSLDAKIVGWGWEGTSNDVIFLSPSGGVWGISAAWNAGDQLWLTWTEDLNDDTQTCSGEYDNVYGALYSATGSVLIAPQCVNGGGSVPAAWGGDQQWSSIAVDADGDVTCVYEGYGVDVSENVSTSSLAYYVIYQQIPDNDPTLLTDLAAGLNVTVSTATSRLQNWIQNGYNSGDVDIVINSALFQIQSALTTAGVLTSTEIDALLGRIGMAMNNIAGLLRGDYYAIQYTQSDANPTAGETTILVNNATANSTRDGSNQVIVVAFDDAVDGGSFTIRVYSPYADSYVDCSCPIVFYDNTKIINVEDTRKAVLASLQAAATSLGVSWSTADGYEGPIDVRTISGTEITARDGTYWELTGLTSSMIAYEITFQGSVHDEAIAYSVTSELTESVAEVQYVSFSSATAGWVSISLGEDATAEFYFDPSNPTTAANAIKNAVLALAEIPDDPSGASGTITVTAVSGSGGLQYIVTFGGQYAGVDQGDITQEVMTTTNTSIVIYNGTVSSFEAVAGGSEDAPCYSLVENTADRGTEQTQASVSMESNGTFFIAYTQYNEYTNGGVYDTNILFQRFTETTDTAGPEVTAVESATGEQIVEDGTLATSSGMSYLVLDFNEALYNVPDVETQLEQLGVTMDESLVGSVVNGVTLALATQKQIETAEEKWQMSVINPDCYSIYLNGTEISGAIVDIQYGLSEAYALGLTAIGNGKYQVVLTFDSDSSKTGNQAFGSGSYTIKLNHYITASDTETGQAGICDLIGNPLNQNGFNQDGNTAGEDFSMGFKVTGINPSTGEQASDEPGSPSPNTTDTAINTTTTGVQAMPVVATAADDSHVVIWVSTAADSNGDIVGQRFDASGNAVGGEFTVSNYTIGKQISPSVSMNDDGAFVVTWYGEGTNGSMGVYARCFNAKGQATGEQFLVSTISTRTQATPSVAIANDGSFVVTWQEYNGTTLETQILARKYDKKGNASGSSFQVDSGTSNTVSNPDIAMDDSGNFVIVWQGSDLDTEWDIYGQRFDSSGNKVGVQFAVNTYTIGDQDDPSVGMDGDGNFVVSWTSFNQTGNNSYDIYARQFNTSGLAITTSEFLVNKTILNNQATSDVACDVDGGYTVVWSSWGQDDSITKDYGIYARMFLGDGSDYKNSSGTAVGEFRVNATTTGNQVTPALSRNASNGDYVVVWVGPDSNIFSRRLDPLVESATVPQGPTITNVVAATSSSTRTLTWSVASSIGIASSTLTIDGEGDFLVGGPYGSDTAAKFTSSLDSLDVGTYTYTIIATDDSGVSSQVTGTFTITEVPTEASLEITNIAVSTTEDAATFNWTVSDKTGILSTSLYIDKVAVDVNGPIGTKLLANYSSTVGSLTAGNHAYVIVATNVDGVSTIVSGTFVVNNAGPAISNVVVTVDSTSAIIGWDAVDADGVSLMMFTLDGVTTAVTRAGGTDFVAAYLQSLSGLSVGTHYYSIVGTDSLGTEGTAVSGSFTTTSPTVLDSTVTYYGDFNGDGTDDVLWQNQSTGLVGAWIVSGGSFGSWKGIGTATIGTWAVAGIGDFNGDGTSDILWKNTQDGTIGFWIINNGTLSGWKSLGTVDLSTWDIVGVGDFNGDKTSDILWQNQSSGLVGTWLIKNAALSSWAGLGTADPTVWAIVGVGDFNADGTDDVLWHNQATSGGAVGAWVVKNAVFTAWDAFGTAAASTWTVNGVADYNNDGVSDILWQNQTSGIVGAWIVKNNTFSRWAAMGQAAPATWSIVGTGDYNGDKTADVLWQNMSSGLVGAWQINGGVFGSWTGIGTADPATWLVLGSGLESSSSTLQAENIVADSSTDSLTQSELDGIVEEAIARWESTGLTADQVALLKSAQFEIANLRGSLLGEVDGNTITIDSNAAGNGWFVDSTASSDEEYAGTSEGSLQAISAAAVDRIDLLTVVEHELGHVLGLTDLDSLSNDLMDGVLGTGVRRNASYEDAVDAALTAV